MAHWHCMVPLWTQKSNTFSNWYSQILSNQHANLSRKMQRTSLFKKTENLSNCQNLMLFNNFEVNCSQDISELFASNFANVNLAFSPNIIQVQNMNDENLNYISIETIGKQETFLVKLIGFFN